MKFGVVVFPGSNCDSDTLHALREVIRQEAVPLWHKDTDLQDVDVVVIPGGFSYGDYLRCGAIARFSPIMESVRTHSREGKLVLGICNGFQILQETGLLPGVMLPNAGLKFICKYVALRVENSRTPFTRDCEGGQMLRMPIAHSEGNFFLNAEELDRLERNGQVVFRYVDDQGRGTPDSNPNGSLNAIAGISNREGNVLGLMPHPERASEPRLGSTDGRWLFRSLVSSLQGAMG